MTRVIPPGTAWQKDISGKLYVARHSLQQPHPPPLLSACIWLVLQVIDGSCQSAIRSTSSTLSGATSALVRVHLPLLAGLTGSRHIEFRSHPPRQKWLSSPSSPHRTDRKQARQWDVHLF